MLIVISVAAALGVIAARLGFFNPYESPGIPTNPIGPRECCEHQAPNRK